MEESKNEYPSESNGGVVVSNFDHSVDNFLASMDSIRELCGLPGEESFEKSEIDRFSSMVTFLKEWKYFVYEPKNINFACEIGCEKMKDEFDGISLPQFSSSTVPKMEDSAGETRCLDSDFVLHAGGLVWGMDWCPREQENSGNSFNCEYLAVAAHPPGSTYHKIGVPLTGRGIIQIWCLLSLDEDLEISPQWQKPGGPKGRPKGSYKKGSTSDLKDKEESKVLKPRGRPRGSKKVELTVPRPRGRPKGSSKKQPHPIENNFNVSIGPALPVNNLLKDMGDLVPFSSANLGESAASTGKLKTLVPKRRGRISKKPGSENIVELPVSADLNSVVDLSQPTKDMNIYQKAVAGNTADQSPPSGALGGKLETLIQKCKGRPRKKPYPVPNEQVSNSENNVALPISADLNSTLNTFLRKREMSVGSGKAVLFDNTADLTPPSGALSDKKLDNVVVKRRVILSKKIAPSLTTCLSESETTVPLPISIDLNSKFELSQKQERSVGYERDVAYNGTMDQSLPSASRYDKLEMPAPKRSGKCSKKPTPGLSECFPGGENIVALSVPTDLNGKRSLQNQDMNVVYGGDVAFNNTADQTPPCDKGTVLMDNVMPGNCVKAVPVPTGANDVVPSENSSSGLSRCRKKRKTKQKESGFSHLQKCNSHLTIDDEHKELTVAVTPTADNDQGQMVHCDETTEKKLRIPKEASLPKVVLCLAHMGKVAWDVKWRPASVGNSDEKHRLGYLAALLGNGSLEVWEIPVPNMVKVLHTYCRADGTDPRFLKLKPIFRCSKLQCGGRQSIPLTLEWSRSAPHDLILGGCHDGTVAIWKFSNQHSSQDMKPLLCFSADSVPIRSLSWAPDESDAESANLIVTAGHEGLKFWDIRDPYRPLWEFNPVQRVILSLDWVRDPRCLIMTFDDGMVRMLSLLKVANDVLGNGDVSGPKKQALLHGYPCSHSAIWSCQVSRATGLAAYCTADGYARFFQLTAKAVEKDASRYREPHFLCGSLACDDGILEIKTSLPKVPLTDIPLKKITSEMGDGPLFSYLSDANQAVGRNLPVLGDNQTPDMNSKLKPRYNNKASDPRKPPCLTLVTEAEGRALKHIENLEEGSTKKIIEVPPKDVAIHKVRWNMNKGSEKWLCYGGAAGIIRCQKIS